MLFVICCTVLGIVVVCKINKLDNEKDDGKKEGKKKGTIQGEEKK